jgi:predicted aldo/keto reductase-like oxidoreductase
VKLIRSAIDSGITFLDNCWDYSNGESEIRMGRALSDGWRSKAFLMTKIDGRTEEEAERQIVTSLGRLRVDNVDLLQLHEVIRFEDVDRFFAPNGAHNALRKAVETGKTKLIGFTGHKDPRIHLYMLQMAQTHQFRFDAVQMPLNVMDAHFRSFERLVLPELVRQKIGVIAMKSLGGGGIVKAKVVRVQECIRYTLSLPISTLVVGIENEEHLTQAVQSARDFVPLSEKDRDALLGRTHGAAQQGRYELFKTSTHYDSTAEHMDWLGEESSFVAALTSE